MKIPVKAFIVTAILIVSPALAQDKLTLKESIALVLTNNEQVRIATESVAGAELKIKESKSLYWPQANVSGSYTRMSLFSEMQFAFLGQTYKFKFGLPNNYDLRGSVVQQVFNWGRTAAAVEMSRAGLDLAQDGVAMAKHMLTYQIVPLFYGTLFFREAIKVVEDNIRAFEKKLDITTQRFDAGLASSFDAKLIQVQISVLKAQKLDFENSIHKFQIAFNALAGREEGATFDPSADLAFEAAKFNSAELIEEAMGNRIEFQQVQHQLNLGKASLDLAKTGNKPSLVASLNYEFRNGYMPDMNKIRGNWSAMLSVVFPVFDGFRVGTQVALAESGLRSLDMQKANFERSVSMEIQSLIADLTTTEQKIEIEKMKIQQAEDALRIAEDRFQNGLLSATDLIDAQNALEGARLNFLQLVFNHTLSKYNLYRSIGRTI
jgi:outer membrane protein